MNILYISHKVPYPLSDGGKLRVFNQIKSLSKKHKIVSLSFIQSKKELSNIDELKKYCKIKTTILKTYQNYINSFFGLFSRLPLRVGYLKSKKMQRLVKKIIKKEKIDIIIIQAIRMAQYLPKNFKGKKILDVVDTPSLQIQRAIKYEKGFIWNILWKLELPRLKRYEQSIIKKFDKIIVISNIDKKALSEKAIVIENGINQKIKLPKKDNSSNLIFVGNMEYPPNIDGIIWFVKKIFPKIKKKFPKMKFYIVGKNPPKKIKKIANNNIIVTGFVKSLDPYFVKCSIAVAPLRTGSGLQNKILEYMLYKTPVVATRIANEGVGAKPNKEIIIANNANEYINQIAFLLKNRKVKENIINNAYKFVQKKFNWNKLNQKLENLIIS